MSNELDMTDKNTLWVVYDTKTKQITKSLFGHLSEEDQEKIKRAAARAETND